jgi:fimbrial chaperone protein
MKQSLIEFHAIRVLRPGALWFCISLMTLATAGKAVAGSFSATPARIDLRGTQRTAVVTLRNADSAPLTVQATLVAWSQPKGNDEYAETHELLVTPPVFTIPPNGEQIVRIALRRTPDPALELPYRTFFQEIPQGARPDFTGLNIALKVSVPIFVQPESAAAGKLDWELHTQPDGKLRVDAVNTGTAHVRVTDFTIVYANLAEATHVNVVKYVLPGSRVSWIVAQPPTVTASTTAKIHGFSDRGEFSVDASIAQSH